MKALDKKLIRDLSRLRGQIIAIAYTNLNSTYSLKIRVTHTSSHKPYEHRDS
ncbi:hypothetical protein [Pelatocladus sp. BLCC-F211]|uniref:hypothetical protein n=1 Tax=Pelatocladus sp. BLCC-F211 TaxID=3342752 RepID=UPI0035BBF78B